VNETLMREFFSTGAATEFILLFMLVEGFALTLWVARSQVRVDGLGLILNLMAGIFLVGAVHSAVVGRDWDWIAACLVGSLLMHIGDLWRRWVHVRKYAPLHDSRSDARAASFKGR
jgi:threonine/homoserine efflux transporter RhtA